MRKAKCPEQALSVRGIFWYFSAVLPVSSYFLYKIIDFYNNV
ncbi:hypothetical protein CLOSCI_00633 [[Clostridium] scindens ATCC 35704]|nr:hypothetical protein CLOSCI_00633 [[Clostridium] scindens ATCC 35704]